MLSRFDFSCHVRELKLNPLEVRDWLPELLAECRIPKRLVVTDAERLRLVQIALFLGDDERADPFGALPRIGYGGDNEDLAHASVSNEDLRSVQDVVSAFTHRRRERVRRITARAGFR